MTNLSWIQKGLMIKYEKEERWPQAISMKLSRSVETYEIVSVRSRAIRVKYESSDRISFLEIGQKSHFKYLSRKRMCGLWIETENVDEGDKIMIENEDFLVEDTDFIKTSFGLRRSLKLTRSSYYPYFYCTIRWYDKITGILLKENFERTFQRQPRKGMGKLLALNINIKDSNVPELLSRALKCSSCSSLLGWAHRNAKYCPFCGQRIAAQNGTRIYGTSNVCTSCGAINGPQARFCNHCGTKLTSF